ncbi:MAG: hypothetical protein AB1921_07990 [Thermodesulfobacteriota bacterium]
MDRNSPYYRSHLVVAACRIILHQSGAPPTVKDIAKLLSYTEEDCQHTVNMLEKLEVLRIVASGSDDRIFVEDPKPLEDLARERESGKMEKELDEYAEKRRAEMDRIKKLATGEGQRKKDLFAALTEKLKKDVSSGNG